MFRFTQKHKNSYIFRTVHGAILTAFFVLTIVPSPAMAQELFTLPAPGTMINPSPVFTAPLLKGIRIFPDNPLKFDFILDTGHSPLKGKELETESSKLIKYFLATLTVPEEDLWVNLSPYEKDRIIPDQFGVTEMGRDLLAQDYILKQLTASLIYPENDLGKIFWDRVYKKAKELYGTTEIPVNTFNKVWVVPDKAVVYENNDIAYIAESHLKVMLEEDYVALSHQPSAISPLEAESRQLKAETNKFSSQIIKEILIPEIEKEVNHGQNFAPLRQVYHSMILATWFKRNLKESLLGKVYVGANKVEGIDIEDKEVKNKIYRQYLEAFKVGAYNYIKEEYDPDSEEMVPKKYFSGGVEFVGKAINRAMTAQVRPKSEIAEMAMMTKLGSLEKVLMLLDPVMGNSNEASDKIIGAMHEGDQDASRRLDALRRWVKMKNIDIEEWANEQNNLNKNQAREDLNEALVRLGFAEENFANIADRIIPVDIPLEVWEKIGLDGRKARIGGLIIRMKDGIRILFPKDRLKEAVNNREYLADLLHEIVELYYIHDLKKKTMYPLELAVSQAHAKALEAQQQFLQSQGVTIDLKNIFFDDQTYDEVGDRISPVHRIHLQLLQRKIRKLDARFQAISQQLDLLRGSKNEERNEDDWIQLSYKIAELKGAAQGLLLLRNLEKEFRQIPDVTQGESVREAFIRDFLAKIKENHQKLNAKIKKLEIKDSEIDNVSFEYMQDILGDVVQRMESGIYDFADLQNELMQHMQEDLARKGKLKLPIVETLRKISASFDVLGVILKELEDNLNTIPVYTLNKTQYFSDLGPRLKHFNPSRLLATDETVYLGFQITVSKESDLPPALVQALEEIDFGITFLNAFDENPGKFQGDFIVFEKRQGKLNIKIIRGEYAEKVSTEKVTKNTHEGVFNMTNTALLGVLIGVRDIKPIDIVKLSDLAYPIGETITFDTFTGEKVVKPAGEDGFYDFSRREVVVDKSRYNFRHDPIVGASHEAVKPKADQALQSEARISPNSSEVGGIDLNPNKLDLRTQGKGIDFNLPADSHNLLNLPINGFAPIIIQIVPANLPLFLGYSPQPVKDWVVAHQANLSLMK